MSSLNSLQQDYHEKQRYAYYYLKDFQERLKELIISIIDVKDVKVLVRSIHLCELPISPYPGSLYHSATIVLIGKDNNIDQWTFDLDIFSDHVSINNQSYSRRSLLYNTMLTVQNQLTKAKDKFLEFDLGFDREPFKQSKEATIAFYKEQSAAIYRSI